MSAPNRTPLLIAVLAGALAACSSTPKAPDTPAPEPKPVEVKPADSAAATQKVAPPVETTARNLNNVEQKPVEPPVAKNDPKPLESIGAPEQRSVYFDYDRYEIKEEFKSLVVDHGKFMVPRADARMLIQGNADERGSREYNLALGQRRADAVKRALMLQGIKEEQIESVSLGEEKPKAPGHDEASWAENRRADMLYKGEF